MDIRKAAKPRIVSKTSEAVAALPTSEAVKEKAATTTESKHIFATTETEEANTTKEVDMLSTDALVRTHLEYLEGKGITKEEIMSVLDMLVSGHNVQWQFQLFNKIDIIFRVRPQWVDSHLLEQLEIHNPGNMARFTDIVGKINLAGSLQKYGDNEFIVETLDDLKVTMEFLAKLPFVVQNKLVNELAIFDRVLIVATSDWAIKNFT